MQKTKNKKREKKKQKTKASSKIVLSMMKTRPSQYGLAIRSAQSSAGDLHSGHLINKGAPGSDSI